LIFENNFDFVKRCIKCFRKWNKSKIIKKTMRINNFKTKVWCQRLTKLKKPRSFTKKRNKLKIHNLKVYLVFKAYKTQFQKHKIILIFHKLMKLNYKINQTCQIQSTIQIVFSKNQIFKIYSKYMILIKKRSQTKIEK